MTSGLWTDWRVFYQASGRWYKGIRSLEGGIRPLKGGIKPLKGDIRPLEDGIRRLGG